jgi:hypothetical protein
MSELQSKGVTFDPRGAFIAGTGWTIANFDLEQCDLPYFQSPYHDDHLAEAEPSSPDGQPGDADS